MKNLILAAVAVISISNNSNAIVRPDWERPIMKANLSLVEGKGFPRAEVLTLNQRDGANAPTSITLLEDNLLRCITTPCPSHSTSEFKIVKVSPGFHSNVVRYEAVQVLKNIPPNVRIAPRKLRLTESSMEIVAPGGHGFAHRTFWEVEIESFPNQVDTYQGNPESVITIQ